MASKHCPTCDETKPVTEFHRRLQAKDGLQNHCKPCRTMLNARRLAEYPHGRRAWNLAKYGLTIESYTALLESQGGACAICRATQPGGAGTWHIDHDHSCCGSGTRACEKCVRALLCYKCNIGLGMFDDDPSRLVRAAEYLARSNL